MAPEDVDAMRRSLAIGGSLTRADSDRLLDTCQALLAQRAAIAAVLGQLGPSWRDEVGAERVGEDCAGVLKAQAWRQA